MEGVLVLLLRFLLVLFYSRVHTKVRGRVLFTWLMLCCKGRLHMNVSLILERRKGGTMPNNGESTESANYSDYVVFAQLTSSLPQIPPVSSLVLLTST